MKNLVWSGLGYDFDEHGNVWFVSYWNSFLCCYSIKERKLARIEVVKDKSSQNAFLFSDVKVVGNEIILVPANAFSIYIYDITKREFTEIGIQGSLREQGNKFMSCVLFHDELYMMPYSYPCILAINRFSKKIREVVNFRGMIELEGGLSSFRYSFCEAANSLYLLSALTNKVLQFNMETEKVSIYSVGDLNDRYNTITNLSINKFAMFTQNGECVIWDMEEKSCSKFETSLTEFGRVKADDLRGTAFTDSVRAGDFLYVFPNLSDKGICFSIKDQSFTKLVDDVAEEYDDYIGLYDTAGFSRIMVRGDRIYGFVRKKGIFFEADLSLKDIDYHSITIPSSDELLDDLLSEMLNEKVVLEQAELDFASLDSLIHIMSDDSLAVRKEMGSNVADSIWRYVK